MTLTVQSLGYTKKEMNLHVNRDNSTLYILLSEDNLKLDDVERLGIARIFIAGVFVFIAEACRKGEGLETVFINGFRHGGKCRPIRYSPWMTFTLATQISCSNDT